MRFLEMGVKKQLGQGGCPAAVVPCGQKAGGLRRQLAKASSLILLQDDTPQTNLEFVWLNTVENHTPSAHHDFKQIENEEKKKRKSFGVFQKKILVPLPRCQEKLTRENAQLQSESSLNDFW